MRLLHKPTERGFSRYDFTDENGRPCSLQKSSIATDDLVWLGCDRGQHIPAPVTGAEVCCARMHVGRELALELIEKLQRFVETGDIWSTSPPREHEGDLPRKY